MKYKPDLPKYCLCQGLGVVFQRRGSVSHIGKLLVYKSNEGGNIFNGRRSLPNSKKLTRDTISTGVNYSGGQIVIVFILLSDSCVFCGKQSWYIKRTQPLLQHKL